jgi:hypothetical protein
MGAKSAVLGVAAATVLSGATVAGPCMQTASIRDIAGELACAPNDKTVSDFIFATRDEVAVVDLSAALAGNVADADDGTDAETFSGGGVKITRLQATMTANTYVAGLVTSAPPPQQHVTDDVSLYTPDYLAVKAMSPIPKRPPPVVGVGLTTAPSQAAKTSGTATKGELTRPLPPALDQK